MVHFFSACLPRHVMFAAALAWLACTGMQGAHAQTVYPGRPIVMVVPQAAGGTSDIVGRVVGQKPGEVLGGSVGVENRPGAGGNIGTQAVARGAKDGYNLRITIISSSQATNPALCKTPGFDLVEDFRPMSLIGAVPTVLPVHPSFPANNVAKLLALARVRPGHSQHASAGNGTVNHLPGEMLNIMGGVSLQHVPCKGVDPAINDGLGGPAADLARRLIEGRA